MKNIISLCILVFSSAYLFGQGVTAEGVKIALDRMLFVTENNEISFNTLTKVQEAVSVSDFSANDYDKLETAYKILEGNYNRVYLARIKQDLTNYKQLKSLMKDPDKHIRRYAKDLDDIIHKYNNTFLPVAMSIIDKKKTRSFDLNFDGDGPVTSDCDGDGVPDEDEPDCDEDGIPDNCDTDDCHCQIPAEGCDDDNSIANQSMSESERLELENSRLNNESQKLNNEDSRNRIERENSEDALRLKSLKTDVLNNKINMFSSAFQIIQTGLDIVNNTTQMVQDTRRERRHLVQSIAQEADNMFNNIRLPSWESLELNRPGGAIENLNRKSEENVAQNNRKDTYEDEDYGDDEEYVDEEYEDEEYEEEDYVDEEYIEKGTIENIDRKDYNSTDEEVPPTNAIFLESISGEVFIELYDKFKNGDVLMPIRGGNGKNVSVPRYDMETDLIIGSKPKATQVSMQTTVSEFETIDSYSAGTYYRVKTKGDAYVYAFSINSGNKMYGFYPYQGRIDKIPYGIGYTTPDNTYFEGDETLVSIPDNENYIMISNGSSRFIPNNETLIVLLSRSELDLYNIFKRMERMDENISAQERLAQIFGSTAATLDQANVRISNHKISYSLNRDGLAVLPLVYNIKRK